MPELYPNMNNADDGDMIFESRPAELEPGPEGDEQDSKWMSVKKWLGHELKELTHWWLVGSRLYEDRHTRMDGSSIATNPYLTDDFGREWVQ